MGTEAGDVKNGDAAAAMVVEDKGLIIGPVGSAKQRHKRPLEFERTFLDALPSVQIGGDGTGQVSTDDLNHSAPVGSPVPTRAAMTAPVLALAAVLTGILYRKQIAIPGFKGLEEDLRSILLDLMLLLQIDVSTLYDFENTCRRVGIVQDQNPNDIRKNVFQLLALKLVNFEYDDETVGLNVEDLWVYKKFLEKGALQEC